MGSVRDMKYTSANNTWPHKVTIDLKCIQCCRLLSPVVPIIPVIIPLAVDISDAVSRDLVVRWTTETQQGL